MKQLFFIGLFFVQSLLNGEVIGQTANDSLSNVVNKYMTLFNSLEGKDTMVFNPPADTFWSRSYKTFIAYTKQPKEFCMWKVTRTDEGWVSDLREMTSGRKIFRLSLYNYPSFDEVHMSFTLDDGRVESGGISFLFSDECGYPVRQFYNYLGEESKNEIAWRRIYEEDPEHYRTTGPAHDFPMRKYLVFAELFFSHAF